MNKKGFTLIELLIVLAIVVISAYVLFGTFKTSDGSQVGKVVKFSYGGTVFDTWEGQMILGGQGTVTRDTFNFSVAKNNPVIIQEISAALNSQQTVKLSYHKNRMHKPWAGSTTYFINKVLALEEK